MGACDFSNFVVGMLLLTIIVLQAVLGCVLSTFIEDMDIMKSHKFGSPGEGPELDEDWVEGMWGFFGWGRRHVRKTRSYGGYRRVSG